MATYRDPYLAWSARTEFEGHAAMQGSDARIPLLIEADAAQRAVLRQKGIAVAEPAQADFGFCTALASKDQLAAVEAAVPAMEMALPIHVPERAPAAQAPEPPFGEPVIAVIDHGCALLQRAFRIDSEHTRLIALWDQGRSDAKSPWQRPHGFSYGRELDKAAIDALLHRLASGQMASESALYTSIGYLLDDRNMVREIAHGTHVLDALGGAIDVRPPQSSAKPNAPDAASRAPLIFVDVPSQSAEDSTGASNGAFLLDALRYIRSRAGGATVVVNISLGAFAGPHDGTSLIERAIDEFLECDGHMVLTIAAGNAALERWHARGEFKAGNGEITELRWRTMPEDSTDSFAEVWIDAADRKASAQLALQLVSPDGRASDWIRFDGADPHTIDDAKGRLMAAVIARQPVASDGGGLFLLATAPSAGPRRATAPGVWRIRLRNDAPAVAARFDAWIQRDEPAWDMSRRSVQSFFDGASPGVEVGGAAGGLSNLATGQRTIVVGASRAEDGRLSRYTSLGGRDRRSGRPGRQIDAAAPADESNTAIGLLAAAVRSNMLMRMGGTSVAAPVAARAIYNHLAGDPGNTPAQKPSTAPDLAQAQRDRLKGLPEKTKRPRGDPDALQVTALSIKPS